MYFDKKLHRGYNAYIDAARDRSIAALVGTPEGFLSYMCIAPSLFFVCVMSAYRGYMQGMRRMMPTAISQLIEQVFYTVVCQFTGKESHDLLFCQRSDCLQQRKNVIDCIFVNHGITPLTVSFSRSAEI